MTDRIRPYVSQDNYWVLVTDPNEYSFRDLERDTQTVWDGVADYVSLKNLRDLDQGEQVLIFHSGDQMAFVGTARIVSDPYPNPRETDASMMVVDVEPLDPLDPPVPLLDLQDRPEFQDFDLVSEPEIEVAPITPEQWERILEMSRDAVANITREEQL
ncbi:MAG TPA: EVE domain-containing protein [Thermoanaerobaculia bacterium]|nr:EVE domain-containing protein [Thermoanaerobaculia bacterium]